MKEISTMQMLNLKEFEGIGFDPNGSMLDYLQALTQRLFKSQEEEEKKVKGKEKLSDSEKRYKQHSKKEKKKKKNKGGKNISASEKRDEQHSEEEEGKKKLKLSDSEQKDEQHSSEEKDKGKLKLSDSEQQWEKKKDDGKRESNGIENLDDQQNSENAMKRSLRKRKRELASDHEFEEPKKNKSKNHNSLALPKELPRVFMETLQRFAEGKSIQEPQLLIEKEVESCDCSKGHNRLSIPLSKLNPDLEFLTPAEHAHLKLRHNNDKNVNEIDVDIIEPTLQKGILSLRRWEMMKRSGNSSVTFNLTKHWNKVVERNSLCPGQFVQLWSTRVDGKLWLLIVKYEEGGGGEENNQNSTTSSDSQSLPGNGNESAGPSDKVSGSSKSSLNLEPDQEHHGHV